MRPSSLLKKGDRHLAAALQRRIRKRAAGHRFLTGAARRESNSPMAACSIFTFGIVCALFASFAVLVPAVAAGKAKFNKVLKIGDKAPDWTDFPGVDGKTHSLGDYRDAKALVLVFTCNHCPVAKQYEERLIQFTKKHEKQVQVVAISVSHNAADRLDKMKSRVSHEKFPFPYLYDESQQSARAYGATVTPHFFVLDADRKIAYMGAFDDNIFDPEKVEKHYLVHAIDAVLAGKEPQVKESLQRGCAIDYE